MKYIVKPGLRYPDWELYMLVNDDEMFICEIQAANAADARDSAQQIVEWFNQEPMEFEV